MNMQVSSINNITFGQLKTRTELFTRKKILKDFETNDSKVGIKNDYDDFYRISLSSKEDPSCSYARALIEINKSEVFISCMSTDDPQMGKGLGTQMHLVSLIEMLENNKCSKMELISTWSAIPFHIKFGFKPKSEWDKNLQDCVRKISKEKMPELNNFAKQAQQLLKVKNLTDEAYAKYGNQLVYNFTKSASQYKSKEEMKKYFDYTLEMELTKKDVLKNKDFYNKLLKKYDFDYEIT